MNETIFIVISIIFLILLILNPDESSLNDDYTIENTSFKDLNDNKLYHPTTGYSCDTQDQMNTYITNRERKLKNNET